MSALLRSASANPFQTRRARQREIVQHRQEWREQRRPWNCNSLPQLQSQQKEQQPVQPQPSQQTTQPQQQQPQQQQRPALVVRGGRVPLSERTSRRPEAELEMQRPPGYTTPPLEEFLHQLPWYNTNRQPASRTWLQEAQITERQQLRAAPPAPLAPVAHGRRSPGPSAIRSALRRPSSASSVSSATDSLASSNFTCGSLFSSEASDDGDALGAGTYNRHSHHTKRVFQSMKQDARRRRLERDRWQQHEARRARELMALPSALSPPTTTSTATATTTGGGSSPSAATRLTSNNLATLNNRRQMLATPPLRPLVVGSQQQQQQTTTTSYGSILGQQGSPAASSPAAAAAAATSPPRRSEAQLADDEILRQQRNVLYRSAQMQYQDYVPARESATLTSRNLASHNNSNSNSRRQPQRQNDDDDADANETSRVMEELILRAHHDLVARHYEQYGSDAILQQVVDRSFQEQHQRISSAAPAAAQGAPRRPLNAVPVLSQKVPNNDCCFCLEPLSTKGVSKVRTCQHHHHTECLRSYYVQGGESCPLCRSSLM